MTEKEVQLAKQLIENHRGYGLKQYKYSVDEGCSKDYSIRLWTTAQTYRTDTFHNTEIIPIVESYFSCYVDYNKDLQRCELHIF